MATSGSASVTVTKWDTLKFSWSRSSYSVANNTSTVSWKLELVATSDGYISSSASRDWSVTVNGTKYTGTASVGINSNATKTLASGSTTIAHNNDGTKSFSYSFSQAFNITFSNVWIGTKSGSGSGTLDSIPRYSVISSATDFTDEGNPTIKFSNPSNGYFSLRAKIEAGGNTKLITRDISKTATSYTFSLTDSERKTLRQLAKSNSLDVRLTICCMNGSTELSASYLDKKMTLVNHTPTLSPTVVDQGTVSTTLTGDPNKIILNYNTVKVAFNATARKEATISSMKVTCGKASRTSDGIMGYVSSGTFVFKVTDSRGNSETKTITKDMINYTPLTCNLSATSDLIDGSTANVNLAIKGKYFAGSFGAATNSLTVEYRYKVNDGDYPTDSDGNEVWTSITGTPSNGEYTAQATITGLDYTNSYTFQARAKDKPNAGGITTPEQVVRIVPVFDWGENDFNFNVPVHGAGGFTYAIPVGAYNANDVLVSGKYYLGNTSTNRPIDKNGWLEVQAYDNGNYCYQKYIVYSGEEYERFRNNGTWGNWVTCCQSVLWSGAWHMNANQTVTLSSPISKQKNGIVLWFSELLEDWVTVSEANSSYHFIPKIGVANNGNSAGHCFTFTGPYRNGYKYLYIYDDHINGNATNSQTVTVDGITNNNGRYVLRAVYGV